MPSVTSPRRRLEVGAILPKPLPPCPTATHLNLKYQGDRCIPLLVGEQEVCFSVHQKRLFSTSSWFETTLKSGLAETVTQQIRLPQDDPETVELFVQWLYGTNPSLSDFTDRTFMQLGRLYEFANRLFIRELKNYIIWKLFELYRQRHVPPMELVQYAFEDLPDDASLRKVLVAWYTGHQDTAKTLTGDALRAIPQFAVELVLAMVNKEEGFPDIFALGPESQYEPPGPSPAK